MFWALGQIAKDIDKWRAEGREQGRVEGREQGRQEGREQGRDEGREQGREQGRAEGREQGRREVIKLLAEQNIELPKEFLKEIKGHPGEPRQS